MTLYLGLKYIREDIKSQLQPLYLYRVTNQRFNFFE